MSAPSGDRLDSWKEIAAYLGREVRTVQLWEKSEALPVHRHRHSRQGTVYAFKPELDAWREARKGAAPDPPKVRRPLVFAAAAVAVATLAVGAFLLLQRPTIPDGGVPSSVVVLPFLDLSSSKDQEYFSDGLTEELIDALTRVPNLRVVARTSAFAFKGKAVDIRQIGRQLNVNAVLEGSVRKAGDQLRVTAQLARVSDGYHLWSHTYDRPLRDVFAVQRELSQAIAAQLRAGDVPRRDPPRDLEAYRLLQEGRYFFNQFDPPESNRKAIERYQQALARDPNFAAAYAGIADAYAYLSETFASAPREVMPKAREAAEKAVALDDSSADAHISLGIVKLDYDRDREGAQREFLRALQLNPGSGYAHHWYAHSLEAQERLPEAMKEMRTALDLDPLSIPIHWDIGSELLAAKRFDDALQHLKKAQELFPNNPIIASLIFETQHAMGNSAAARSSLESMRAALPAIAGEPVFLSMAGRQAASEGRPAEARQFLTRMEQMRATRYVDAFWALPLCAALHDRKQLQIWLKRADDERSSMSVYLPLFRDLYAIDPAPASEPRP